MEFSHAPVMPNECIENLSVKADGIYVDGTLGGGGHASMIASKLSKDGALIGIDCDTDAIKAASERLADAACKTYFVHENYSNIKNVLEDLEISAVDGALLDLGVSSFQLDNPERGFSYMHDAPLDMRMDQNESFCAWDVVNGYTEKELGRIIREYGEERWASRISKFICAAREKAPIETTGQLVEEIKKAIPASARREGPHPAKRTFQAIRIEVNDELGRLKNAVTAFIDVLAPGGRLAVITFHSLEDRIVKDAFANRLNPCTCPPDLPVCICGKKADVRKVTGKPIVPTEEEIEKNPRSRSAKLRVIEKKRA